MKKQRQYASISTRLIAFSVDTLLFMLICLPPLNYFSHHFIYATPPEAAFSLAMQEMQPSDITSFSAAIADFMGNAIIKDYFGNYGNVLRILVDQLLQLVSLFLITAFFHAKWGATPGQWLFRIKVINASFADEEILLSWKKAVLRQFATIISSLPLTIGVLSARLNPTRQMWHDKLSSAVVIKH